MSKECAQTVGNKKFGLLLVLLAALAVFATIGSQWRGAKAFTMPDGGQLTDHLALPAVPSMASPPCTMSCPTGSVLVANDIAVPNSNNGLTSEVALWVIVEPAVPVGRVIASEVISPSPGQSADSVASVTSSGSNSDAGNCMFNCTTRSTDNVSTNDPGHGTTGTTGYTLNFQVTNGLCATCVFTKVSNSSASNSLLGVLDNGHQYGAMSASPGEAEHVLVSLTNPAAASVPGGTSDNSLHTSQATALHEPGTVRSLGVGLVMIFALALGVGFARGYRTPAYAYGPNTGSPSTVRKERYLKRATAPINRFASFLTDKGWAAYTYTSRTTKDGKPPFNKRE